MLKRASIVSVALLVVVGSALAQTSGHTGHGESAQSHSLQGDVSAWHSNPYTYAFYGAAVAAFAGGIENVDEAALQKAYMQLAGDFAVHMGADPAMMRDHLKLIPEQLIEIVREDPHVLDNYENMMLAMRGPD